MSELTAEQEVEQIATEAKEGFDLEATLNDRAFRTASITVFTDEVTGEKLEEVEQAIAKLVGAPESLTLLQDAAEKFGLADAAKALRDIHDGLAESANPKILKRLEAERDELKKEMGKTALTFELRAVPTLIIKDARRKAKAELGIVGKGIPEASLEQFEERATAHVLSNVVRQYTNASGAVNKGLTSLQAGFLGDTLPEAEFHRLTLKLNEIQFKNVIGESVTASADF